MNKLRQSLFFFTISVFLCLSQNSLFAQIVISAGDMLDIAGKQETFIMEEEGSFNFDTGSAGANQIWDFRSMMFTTPMTAMLNFYFPQGTSEENVFPNANLVQKFAYSDSTIGTSNFYNFYNVTENFLISLGDSSYFSGSGFDTSIVTISSDTVASLPIQYGDSWATVTADTQLIADGFSTIDTETAINTVDAWGTVRLPMGDFECLRLRVDAINTNKTIANGVEISVTADTSIGFYWHAKGLWEIAWVESQPGETNPNFTDASSWGRLDAVGPLTAVSEAVGQPEEFALQQNYPNPFNPETTIAFDLSENSNTKLEIYTLLGQKIATLVDQNLEAGHHQIRWNATNQFGAQVAAGVYIYQLKSGNTVQSRKMLLLR